MELTDNTVSENPHQRMLDEKWPLPPMDPKRARFPCCIVWTPLPIVSWLAPFIGHVGIAKEDGTILDFAGSNFVNVDNFAFGAVARYIQLDREKCCFPPHLAAHTCKNNYEHAEYGTALTWDDALRSSTQNFQHKSYNLFTCNCHSFVANCLNRFSYGGTMRWNIVNLAVLILFKGKWVNHGAVVRSFLPFIVVLCAGIIVAGWPTVIGLASFSLLLIGWFVFVSYFAKNLIEV
ncbi:protein REVERSION-TO-ETHYLENE SENSITIVITY1 [Nymphaea colorata]|nr:protein REVERSION-TO-ETHYLENE SENSITIVITY1 [Nymphaea colorata]